MNQPGVKGNMAYTGAAVITIVLTGAVTTSALALASAETASGGFLAGAIIKLVNLFIKLVLFIA